MSAGNFIIPDKAFLNMEAAGILGANTSNFRAILLTSSHTPNDATVEVLADIVANEIAAGNGYVSGGVALSGVALSQTGGALKFTASPWSWTASGGNIPAWRHQYVYYLGTQGGKVNPIVCRFVGDTTSGGTDVPATTPSASPLTVTPPVGGIIAGSKS